MTYVDRHPNSRVRSVGLCLNNIVLFLDMAVTLRSAIQVRQIEWSIKSYSG